MKALSPLLELRSLPLSGDVRRGRWTVAILRS
jgi:hypothetical protein